MLKRLLKGKKGQALAEFAIILPVIIILLGMVISGGQLFFTKMTMQMAAYEAARAGVTMPTSSQAQTEATNTAKKFVENMPLVEPSGLTVKTLDTSGTWKKGSAFQVTVSYPMKVLFPVPGTDYTLDSTHTISGQIRLAIENGN